MILIYPVLTVMMRIGAVPGDFWMSVQEEYDFCKMQRHGMESRESTGFSVPPDTVPFQFCGTATKLLAISAVFSASLEGCEALAVGRREHKKPGCVTN
jgi:hypothetical protein